MFSLSHFIVSVTPAFLFSFQLHDQVYLKLALSRCALHAQLCASIVSEKMDMLSRPWISRTPWLMDSMKFLFSSVISLRR